MSEHLLIGIAVVFLLGIGAQWLAWRFKLPSILLLLIFGFLAGPVSGVLTPEMLAGEWVFAVVALSVGIILFEGGLSLKIDELREVGTAVRNLIVIGTVVTWLMGAAAAHYIVGFNLSMSFIIGAILVVTGPTVILPLLRHVRPTARIGTVAKWEGITIDPIGALLAVLVLDVVLLLNDPAEAAVVQTWGSAVQHAVRGLFLNIVIGTGVSIIGAALLVLLLRRRMVPDFLQSPLALAVVVCVFVLSDTLHPESGLLATTLMGIMVVNQPYVAVRRIVEFKEDLRVLLIGSLFIILSARLELNALASFMNPRNLIFLGVLMLIVRPIAVFLSSLGTKLSWREQVFMSWLAPRGIVAAAVASLFSFRLQYVFPAQAEALVPTVFMVIVGTVAIYGLTITPLARRIGVAQPSPDGALFVGAHPWARKLAAALKEHGIQVLMVDSNWHNVYRARSEGMEAQQANVLSEGIVDELNLGGIGRLLAMTPNDEVNSLTALSFNEVFESAELYQLPSRKGSRQDEDLLPRHLRGRPLFGPKMTFPTLSERFDRGAEVEAIEIKNGNSVEDLQRIYGKRLLPAFVVRSTGRLHVLSDESSLTAAPGDILIGIVDPERGDEPEEEQAAA